MRTLNRANTNSFWSSILVETLVRCGLKHAVISPGSRSTPLTVAFAGHPSITAVPVLDERSAGFFALGLAKQTHKPVVLVCTSGTAAVNYFPAVVEASEARVPLLALTADRPPELRNCGAGQTIDQIRLYGKFPLYQEELPLPGCQWKDLEILKTKISHAYNRARCGPVHLNCPYRDPLPPIQDGSALDFPAIDIGFFKDVDIPIREQEACSEPIRISADKGIIICGTEAPEGPEAYCREVARLSDVSGWPVLADGLSPVRNHAALQNRLVTTYDFLLRNSGLRTSLKPECVIALGPLPTSKELRKWLTECSADLYHVHQTGKNLDPTRSVVQVIDADISQLNLRFTFSVPGGVEYTDLWMASQARVIRALGEVFNPASGLSFEGLVSWWLPRLLPQNTPVFVASSMPVRDVEYFWPPNNRKHTVHASRGVNGIDGTLSTALGMAYEHNPSILLTGDLAFLHDSNGLLIRPKLRGHLTVLLINNHGGGIFNHLPISQFDPPFEEFFATPQEVDFKRLVESTGCDYLKASTLSELSALITELPNSGIRVIEIETNRKQDAEYRKELFKTITRSLA